jgi:hypothetical protein
MCSETFARVLTTDSHGPRAAGDAWAEKPSQPAIK